MKLSPQIKRRLLWQNRIFLFLFLTIIILLGWLSIQFNAFIDVTSNNSNYPSKETEQLLQTISAPISITAFVSPGNIDTRDAITKLVKKYQHIKSNVTLKIIDPVREPQLVRKNDIRTDGELIVQLKNQSQHINQANEESLTNAISHLSHSSQNWILFLEGHDERSPFGKTSFDYSAWYKILKHNGINVRGYNLANNSNIPENTALLVIADPQKQFLHGETNVILNYIDRGGNLLWLIEPGKDNLGTDTIAEALGIEVLPGIVVDPNTQVMGINDPRFTLITDYPSPKITGSLKSITIFPTAAPLNFLGSDEWDSNVLLQTLPRTWSAEGNINDITIDTPHSANGPLVIGYALSRPANTDDSTDDTTDDDSSDDTSSDPNTEQHVVVIGDSDFVSDSYIGEAGNMDFAGKIISWLIQSDDTINISTPPKLDQKIVLSKTQQIIIGFGFLAAIPLLLVLNGAIIWRIRRKK